MIVVFVNPIEPVVDVVAVVVAVIVVIVVAATFTGRLEITLVVFISFCITYYCIRNILEEMIMRTRPVKS